jgi:hypothetical protein
MKRTARRQAGKAYILAKIAAAAASQSFVSCRSLDPGEIDALVVADLLARRDDGGLDLTPAGRAFLARATASRSGADPYLGQHLAIAERAVETPLGRASAMVDDSESPLAWLARRKGKDGKPMIEAHQLQAGERLRADFTRANLMPRVTSNWTRPITDGVGAADASEAMTHAVVDGRRRVARALDAVGQEFAGLLVDVCCFLKGLEDVERERAWPPRSAKVVLQLGLDRLARHYGLRAEARGRAALPIRTWLAPEAVFTASCDE